MAIGVPKAGDDLIFIPGAGRTGQLHVLGQLRVVAAGDVEGFAIGRQDDAVRSVLTTAVDPTEHLLLVVLVIAVGVAQAPEPLAPPLLVDHHVQATEGVQQTVRTTDGVLELLDGRRSGRTRSRQRQTVQATPLIAGNQATLGIHRHAHPGSLLGLGHSVN